MEVSRISNRNSNIELLRICLMLMIIAGHLMMKHEVQSDTFCNYDEGLKLFFRGAFCVAVNSYVMISGYFGIKFKKERLYHLSFQTFFYSALFMSLAIGLGWHEAHFKTDVFAYFPIIAKQYWFITCYVVLYILSPWINIGAQFLEKDAFRTLLVVGFFLFYVWPTLSYLFNAPQFIGDSGYGIVNFIYLYMLGRYIKLYNGLKLGSQFYFWGYIIAVVSLFICQFSISYLLGFKFTSWFSYNTVFCFVGSVCLFMAFKSISFHSKKINFWAKPCLAVYLIHMAPFVLSVFCESIGLDSFHGMSLIGLVLVLSIVIYFVCAVIEMFRQRVMRGLEEKYIALLMKIPTPIGKSFG